MKISISPEMKSRLQNAAANGSVVAEDILVELGKNRDASETIRGTYNYFTTKRIGANHDSYHKIRIMFTACAKNLEHENFPDKGKSERAVVQRKPHGHRPLDICGAVQEPSRI